MPNNPPNSSKLPQKVPPKSGGAKKPPRKPPKRKSTPTEKPGEFDFVAVSQTASADGKRREHRPKKSSGFGMLIVLVGCAVGCLAVGVTAVMLGRSPETLALKPIEHQSVNELTPLELVVEADVPDSLSGDLEYSIVEGPEGATIGVQTGKFTWRPTEQQGPNYYDVIVKVVSVDNPKQTATAKFGVTVAEDNRPPVFADIAEQQADADIPFEFVVQAEDPDSPSLKLNYRLVSQGPGGARIDSDTGLFTWLPGRSEPGKAYRFEVKATEAVHGGLSSTVTFDVVVKEKAPPPTDVAVVDPTPVVDDPPVDKFPQPVDPRPVFDDPPKETPRDIADKKMLELFEQGEKMFSKKEYPAIRKTYADLFEQEHREEIEAAYGNDCEEMTAWLDENSYIREEFYTAIDPQTDDVETALSLMNELRKQFPEKIVPYGELAIATAVTWDQPRRGVYDYAHHASRAKSPMPEGLLGAVENFKYLVDAEKFMQGRIIYMPWEFLVLTVDHKTPLNERGWAMQNYVTRRVGFGACYKDVPYDHTMLESQSAVAKLNNHAYTLPNIRTYGGVCAMQADFAGRVGKSIGVPAAYVRGESANGELHAWVMWVELISVSPKGIKFSLRSEGRYFGDKYYVGTLLDPQSGQRITDRQLEVRLQTVGQDWTAKRQAELVMKAYPMLAEKTEMNVNERLNLLHKVIDLCPGNEEAWKSLAQISRDGLVEKKQYKAMMKCLDRLFVTFQLFPDFTWEVFDDLIAFQEDPERRTLLYARLLQLYVAAKRPDLACEARLKYTDYLEADEDFDTAIEGLAATILAFPSEGRYVPKMLDRLEAICSRVEGKEQALLQFYQNFLPRVPKFRGSTPSKYCIKMYERAIQRFSMAGQMATASVLQAQLNQIKAGKR